MDNDFGLRHSWRQKFETHGSGKAMEWDHEKVLLPAKALVGEIAKDIWLLADSKPDEGQSMEDYNLELLESAGHSFLSHVSGICNRIKTEDGKHYRLEVFAQEYWPEKDMFVGADEVVSISAGIGGLLEPELNRLKKLYTQPTT